MSLWLLGTAALFAAAPWIAEGVRRPVSALRDATTPLAPLPRGAVHYRWHGPLDGPVVLLIHGLTTASYVFIPQVGALTEAGYRVLTFDHYGRGLSDDGPAEQTAEMFVEEVTGLLEHLEVAQLVGLVGYSMGGAIATVLAARRPDLATHVVLIAPAGLTPLSWGSWGAWLRPPVMGHWFATVIGPALLRREIRAANEDQGDCPGLAQRQIAETHRRGYLPAVRASVRGLLAGTLKDEHLAIAGAKTPVTAIWGEADKVTPPTGHDQLERLNPSAQQVTIAGAGHGLAYTHARKVNAALLAALSKS